MLIYHTFFRLSRPFATNFATSYLCKQYSSRFYPHPPPHEEAAIAGRIGVYVYKISPIVVLRTLCYNVTSGKDFNPFA